MANLLFELNPCPMLIYDTDTLIILKGNKSFHQKYKYSPDEIAVGSVTLEHIRPKKNIPELHKVIKSIKGDDTHQSGVHCHLSKTGEKFYMQVTSQNYPYKGTEARLVTFQDLTRRIEAEKKSMQAFEELRHHIGNSPLASVKLDHNFRIVEWSERAEEMSGFSEEDVLNKTLLETLFYKQEYHKEIKRKIDQLRSGQRKRDIIESKIATKQGDSVVIRIHVSTRRKKNGKFESALALIEDLTNQKRIETHYKRLFEFVQDGIYLLTKEGRLVDCNRRAADQLKASVDDIVGNKVTDHAPEYQRDGTRSVVKAAKMTEKALKQGFSVFEWVIKQSDDELLDVEISLNSIQFPEGEYIHAIARDITDTKSIQDKLKKSEELFRNLFLKSPAALVMVDPYEKIQAVNESFQEMFGYSLEEIKDENIDHLLVPAELYDTAPSISEGSYAEKEFQIETVRLTKSGERKHVIAAGMPVYINEEAVAGFGMYIDITDRKIYENELSDSVEEKQVMLEEIHHRVKNNLAVISGILQLQAFDAADENARDALNNSQLRIKSMALAHEMLYETENFSNISFESYLHQLLEHIQISLPLQSKNIDVNIECDDIEMTMQQAIPAALLVNELVTNAYKHAFTGRESGNIDIVVSKSQEDICLRVADNGKGLGENFEVEGSKSLGLSLIKTLADQLNADLTYGNENGAFFEFCIPEKQ